ncbi:hypothetical protein V2J09_019020 [Rumex salicifolius]
MLLLYLMDYGGNPLKANEEQKRREIREVEEMAGVSIFKPSMSNSQRIMSLLSPNSLPIHLLSKNKASLLARASSQAVPSLGLELSLSVGVHQIPHPNKVDRGGEDAFFISSYNGGVIGVADGVSGWAEKNVDPALFSREIMANASSFVEDNEVFLMPEFQSFFMKVNYDPQILLMKAHASTTKTGSATVIVAMMERNGTLKIANVGDCGIRIIRKGKLIFSSCPVEHYFDCPYQMSSEPVTQTYLDAVVSSVKLIEGDIIVMGSDGLFDNVFDHEILSSVANQTDVTETAKVIARLANEHSKDIKFDSPYTIEARSRGIDVPEWKKFLGMRLTGGKLDDITVIVARVLKFTD